MAGKRSADNDGEQDGAQAIGGPSAAPARAAPAPAAPKPAPSPAAPLAAATPATAASAATAAKASDSRKEDALIPFAQLYEALADLPASAASLPPARLFGVLEARIESFKQLTPTRTSGVTLQGSTLKVSHSSSGAGASVAAGAVELALSPLEQRVAQDAAARFGLSEQPAQAALLFLQFLHAGDDAPGSSRSPRALLDALKAAEDAAQKHSKANAADNPAARLFRQSQAGGSVRAPFGKSAAADDHTAAVAERRDELLDAFAVFYCAEQAAVPRCLGALVRLAAQRDDGDGDTDDDGDARLEGGAAADEAALELSRQHRASAKALLQRLHAPDGTYALACLDHLQHALIERELPAVVRENARYATFWATQGLRQQAELADALFLLLAYTRRDDAPLPAAAGLQADVALRVLHLVHATDFAKRQANGGFHASQEAQALLTCVSGLLCLLAAQSVGLAQLLQAGDSPRDVLHAPHGVVPQLAANADTLSDALDVIEALRPDPLWAPVLVAWALALNRIDAALEDLLAADTQLHTPGAASRLAPNLRALHAALDPGSASGGSAPAPAIWTRLAGLAFSAGMQLNAALAGVLAALDAARDPKHAPAAPARLEHRRAVRELLLAQTELVKPEYMRDPDAYLDACELTFGRVDVADERLRADVASELCAPFWREDVQYDTRAAFLRMATARWPIAFRPLPRLLAALSGRSTASSQGSSSAFASDDATAAATAAFEHFAALPSVAHTLPAHKPMGNAYEVIESADAEAVVYRLVRPLRIFGTRNVLPAGTLGRIVSDSDKGPVTVVWQLDDVDGAAEGFSGWRLLRDVLASFAGLLDDGAVSASAARGQDPDRSVNVFAAGEEQGPTDFAALTPESSDEERMLVASDALELFACILSAGQELALRLLAHLDGSDDMSMQQETHSPVSLTRITVRILDLCLAQQRLDTRLISAAYTVLTHLLEVRPASVWTALRPSNVLVGSAGMLSLRNRGTDSGMLQSALLEAEMQGGQYDSVLALLDLHTALILELAQSHFSAPPYLLELKAWVATRALTWVLECVWADCLTWRYDGPHSKLLILRKCVRIFNAVFSDRTLWGPAASKLGGVYEVLHLAFFQQRHALALGTFKAVLASSNTLVQDCSNTGDPLLADSAARLVRSTLLLGLRIVQRQRDLNSACERSQTVVGAIESMIFDPSLIARPLSLSGGRSQPTQLAATIVDVVGILQFPEAAMFLAEVTRSVSLSVSRVQRTPLRLTGCLGTMEEMQERITTLLQLAKVRGEDPSPLASTIWSLFAALTQGSPPTAGQVGLAAVLLTGEPWRESKVDGASSKGQAKDSDKAASALNAAVELIEDWERLWRQDANLLENVIKYLITAWSRRAQYPQIFRCLLERRTLWDQLTALLKRDESDDIDADEVQILAVRLACKAKALRLLSLSMQDLNPSVDGTHHNVDALLTLMSEQETFKAILQNAAQVAFNAGMLGVSEEDMKTLAASLPFGLLRNPPLRDDFDMSRQFGDNYVYDFGLLATKFIGYQSPDSQNVKEGEALAPHAIAQAGGIVVAINREWSAVDSQIFYLRAWSELLSDTVAPIRAHAEKNKALGGKVRASAFQAWLAVGSLATGGAISGPAQEGIHRTRLSLLAGLLELAWYQDTPIEKADVAGLISAFSCIQSLLERSESLLEASLRGLTPEPLHPDLFRLVLLACRKQRQLVTTETVRSSLDAKQHRDIHKAVNLYALQTAASLRVVADYARPVLASRALAQDAEGYLKMAALEEDVARLSTILEQLIRPEAGLTPSFLAATLQATSLLPACIELFAALPIGQGGSHADSGNGSPMAVSLLSFFLTLSAHPTLSEAVVLSGLMTALSNNPLSPELEEGLADMTNLQQACWLLMLRIVTSLAITFGERLDPTTSQGFVTGEVVSFVQLYLPQFERMLDFSPVNDAGPGFLSGQQGQQAYSDDDLKEIEAGLQLLVLVTEYLPGAASQHHAELLQKIASGCARLLQQASYLLLRPHLLSSTFGIGDSDGATEQEKRAVARAQAEVVERTENIVLSAVAAISNVTRAADVLCVDLADLTVDPPVITPRLRVSPSEPATTGTLIDVAQHLTDQLKSKARSTKDARSEHLIGSLEQTLTLAVTQLAVALYNRSGAAHLSRAQSDAQAHASALAQKEVDAGLGRDVGSAIAAAEAALALAGDQGAARTALFSILQAYVDRNLLSSSRGGAGGV